MKKRKVKKTKLERNARGFVGTALLLAVIALAFVLVGGFSLKNKPSSYETSPSTFSSYTCCDTGDGDACKPSDTSKITWKGTNVQPEEYALIKSGIALSEGSGHLAEHDPTTTGERVFVNTGDTTAPYCPGEDTIGGSSGCILNDEVIYICKSECPGSVGTGKFDAYFRVKDGTIPDVIKNCSKPSGGSGGGTKQEVIFLTEAGKTNLQLQTFRVTEKDIKATWLSPYCKPAIYLYPERRTEISVKVNSSNPLTYTDPFYPNEGWNVIGSPNGIIEYLNKKYDYLYYETTVSDSDVGKPSEGYVVKQEELSNLFSSLLPSLGLNGKETKQFSDYWINKLPKSPYYFVGIVPKADLDKTASLDINPKPQAVIRVALFFETLSEKINVPAPKITTPERFGFTVSEWGGIFKRHPGQNFSCFE